MLNKMNSDLLIHFNMYKVYNAFCLWLKINYRGMFSVQNVGIIIFGYYYILVCLFYLFILRYSIFLYVWTINVHIYYINE